MCGRYAFYDPKEIFEIRMLLEEISSIFDEKTVLSIKQGEVFPSETAAVLAQSPTGFRAYPMQWGYTVKNTAKRIINARAETIAEKPMFAGSLRSLKCAVPCTGFFEWQKTENRSVKHLVTLKDMPFFYLGGLYNQFRQADGSRATRFVIITTPADSQMRHIHSRMPLMILPEQKEDWLTQKEEVPAYIDAILRTKKALAFTAL